VCTIKKLKKLPRSKTGLYSHNNNNYNNNQKTEKVPGRNARQTFHGFIAENCRNIAHTKESATVGSLKLEWGGAPLVQGKEHREKHVLIIIIIIWWVTSPCSSVRNFQSFGVITHYLLQKRWRKQVLPKRR
jgi:hypothetical protein